MRSDGGQEDEFLDFGSDDGLLDLFDECRSFFVDISNVQMRRDENEGTIDSSKGGSEQGSIRAKRTGIVDLDLEQLRAKGFELLGSGRGSITNDSSNMVTRSEQLASSASSDLASSAENGEGLGGR